MQSVTKKIEKASKAAKLNGGLELRKDAVKGQQLKGAEVAGARKQHKFQPADYPEQRSTGAEETKQILAPKDEKQASKQDLDGAPASATSLAFSENNFVDVFMSCDVQ